MYIEEKDTSGVYGKARIGLVTLSKTGKPRQYREHIFRPINGFKTNYADVQTGAEFWISGCKKDGTDALYNTDVEIDDDVREEYWTQIRKVSENVKVKSMRVPGKYGNGK